MKVTQKTETAPHKKIGSMQYGEPFLNAEGSLCILARCLDDYSVGLAIRLGDGNTSKISFETKVIPVKAEVTY